MIASHISSKSPAPTLVIADYPIGYASGFGETLYNLFSGFPGDRLWSAHPAHTAAADSKQRGHSVCLPSPARPSWLPNVAALAYYPLLKTQQLKAARSSLQLLSEVVVRNSIKNLLVIPVSPWILSAARVLHERHPKLNFVFYVMDDWQGHHECHQLPYSHWRRRLLREVIDRASTRFAVSREMAAHYEETFGKSWLVAHNGVRANACLSETNGAGKSRQVLLAGDINVFRFDAVVAFAEAIERHNQRNGQSIGFTVMGDVAEQYRAAIVQTRRGKVAKPAITHGMSECNESGRSALLATRIRQTLCSYFSLFTADKTARVFGFR